LIWFFIFCGIVFVRRLRFAAFSVGDGDVAEKALGA